MGKLIILSGISGSGKSTMAHQLWGENPLTTVIIQRDKIRELLYGYTEEAVKNYYDRVYFNTLEAQVTEAQDQLIDFWLGKGKDIIIDNTNLKMKYINYFKKFDVPMEIKFFDVTLKEALTRDMGRKRQVGEEIIKRQYEQYLILRKNN